MNIKNFAINNVAIYEPIVLGDIIKMTLTHTTGGHTIEFYPYILAVYPTYFTARIECVIDPSEEVLGSGKIYLVDGDGFYSYTLLNDDVEFEDGQLFIQAQQNVALVTQPYFGKNGTSGVSGSSGSSGADGVDGINGTSGQNGTSGINGTSGVNGATGIAGSSGSSGQTGSSGTSGQIGAAGSSGSSGASGSSGTSSTAGGGLTSPMQKSVLPPIKGTPEGGRSWRTWVGVPGYSRSPIGSNSGSAHYGIFAIGENETITQLQFYVDTAGSTGSTCWVSIYRLEKDSNGEIYMSDRLVNCGTVSSETTGVKTITLVTPFTMAHETYGAVGIVVGSSDSIDISAWANVTWDGNGGIDPGLDGTFYRSTGLGISGSLGSSPADLTSYTYGSSTNNSSCVYLLIR